MFGINGELYTLYTESTELEAELIGRIVDFISDNIKKLWNKIYKKKRNENTMKCYTLVEIYPENGGNSERNYIETFKTKKKAVKLKKDLEQKMTDIYENYPTNIIRDIMCRYGELIGEVCNVDHPENSRLASDVIFPKEFHHKFNCMSEDFQKLFIILYRKYPEVLEEVGIDLSEEEFELFIHFINHFMYSHSFISIEYEIAESELDLDDLK